MDIIIYSAHLRLCHHSCHHCRLQLSLLPQMSLLSQLSELPPLLLLSVTIVTGVTTITAVTLTARLSPPSQFSSMSLLSLLSLLSHLSVTTVTVPQWWVTVMTLRCDSATSCDSDSAVTAARAPYVTPLLTNNITYWVYTMIKHHRVHISTISVS